MSLSEAFANRQRRGCVAQTAGRIAEDCVRAHYSRAGHEFAEARWRCPAGEIDLIFRNGDEIVFVEVKRARDFAAAAGRIRPNQIARILRAAEVYLDRQPLGTNTCARFDVALVDATGRIETLQNAFSA